MRCQWYGYQSFEKKNWIFEVLLITFIIIIFFR